MIDIFQLTMMASHICKYVLQPYCETRPMKIMLPTPFAFVNTQHIKRKLQLIFLLVLTKDMYKEKHIASNFVAFDEHQLYGWLKDIAQPIRSIIQVSKLFLSQDNCFMCIWTNFGSKGYLYWCIQCSVQWWNG